MDKLMKEVIKNLPKSEAASAFYRIIWRGKWTGCAILCYFCRAVICAVPTATILQFVGFEWGRGIKA